MKGPAETSNEKNVVSDTENSDIVLDHRMMRDGCVAIVKFICEKISERSCVEGGVYYTYQTVLCFDGEVI